MTNLILHKLRQRFKEPTARLFHDQDQDHDRPVRDLMAGFDALLPAPWLHPRRAAARIRFQDVKLHTPDLRDTPWTQRASFDSHAGVGERSPSSTSSSVPPTAVGPLSPRSGSPGQSPRPSTASTTPSRNREARKENTEMRKLIPLAVTAAVSIAWVPSISAAAPDPAVTVNGFVDASYSGNLDQRTDTFGLDQVEVDLTRGFGEAGALRADLEWVKNGDAWDVAVEQAYLDYVPEFAPALTVTFGRFNAPIGFEGIDAPDRYQFSHGLVYDYTSPTNLTGIMIATDALEGFVLRGFLANGWDDNDLEDAGPKTFGGRADYGLGDLGNIGLVAISGKVADGDGADRTVVDMDVTLTPVPGLLLGGELSLGFVDVHGESHGWTGVLVMGHYDFNAWAGITGRVDWLDDPDDLLFGTGLMETRTDFTIAPTFVLGEGMRAIAEVRLDRSSEDVFEDSDGEAKGSTVSYGFEMTYVF